MILCIHATQQAAQYAPAVFQGKQHLPENDQELVCPCCLLCFVESCVTLKEPVQAGVQPKASVPQSWPQHCLPQALCKGAGVLGAAQELLQWLI